MRNFTNRWKRAYPDDDWQSVVVSRKDTDTITLNPTAKKNKRRSPVADYGLYVVVRLLVCVVQSLSLSTCVSLSRGLAWLLHDVIRIRAQVVDDNLRHAFPDLDQVQRLNISRGMFEHLILMVCEIAHAQRKIHETNWRDHFELVGGEPLVRAMLEPRPVLALTAHHGNFEMNGYIAGLLGFPTFTLARTLDNPYLDRFLSRFRGATGQYILPTKNTAALAEHVIDAGETLAALGDHYGGPKGCWIRYFNRPASCHKALALFSLAQKAPLVVVYTQRTTGPMHFRLHCVATFDPQAAGEAASVKSLTQWYSDHVEQFVRGAPEQYWWLHRRWKDTRAAHRANRRQRKDQADQLHPKLHTRTSISESVNERDRAS